MNTKPNAAHLATNLWELQASLEAKGFTRTEAIDITKSALPLYAGLSADPQPNRGLTQGPQEGGAETAPTWQPTPFLRWHKKLRKIALEQLWVNGNERQWQEVLTHPMQGMPAKLAKQ